jgi:hypothetical protein
LSGAEVKRQKEGKRCAHWAFEAASAAAAAEAMELPCLTISAITIAARPARKVVPAPSVLLSAAVL